MRHIGEHYVVTWLLLADASRDLFEKLMADEEHHIDFLETQLDLVAKLGLELYAQHHIGEMGEGDKD